MNIKERLRHIAAKSMTDRMTGRTTMIAKAAEAVGGIVLAHNHDDAKRIERAFKVPARSMEVNLEGYSGPFFMDHHATDRLLLKAADKIEAMEKEQKKLIEVMDKHFGQQKTDEILCELSIPLLRAYK